MAQVAILITYREILDKEPTLAELGAILAKYSRRELIFLFSKLNCLLGTWQNTPTFDLDSMLGGILLPMFKSKFLALRKVNPQRLLFSRLTLLYLVKQACQASPESGLLIESEEAYSNIGLACLMANDLVLTFIPSESDKTIEKLASTLPFSNYVPADHSAIEIARSREMFEVVSQAPSFKARADFIDLQKLIEVSSNETRRYHNA